MNLESAYSVMKLDGDTLIDVVLADNENDLYVQTYIENKRSMAKKLYEGNNVALLKKLLELEEIQINYVSSYSPCIFANLTTTAISQLI